MKSTNSTISGSWVVLVPLLLLFVGLPAYSAIYLKIGEIKGEVQSADGHDDWIEIQSVSWPGGRAPIGASTTRTRSDTQINDVSVSKSMDASSPKLSEACVNGTTYPEAELHVGNANRSGGRERYTAYTLVNVMITCTSSGSGGDGTAPSESYTFRFSEIEVAPVVVRPQGNQASGVRPGRVTPKPVVQGVQSAN
ncbi:MAG: type VI secretion system tube protein Hcp [Gammaproteobacteria bacterium]|nr:type VI secretion system tube protein Hcp [Gammaproteobacteria bacterium]